MRLEHLLSGALGFRTEVIRGIDLLVLLLRLCLYIDLTYREAGLKREKNDAGT